MFPYPQAAFDDEELDQRWAARVQLRLMNGDAGYQRLSLAREQFLGKLQDLVFGEFPARDSFGHGEHPSPVGDQGVWERAWCAEWRWEDLGVSVSYPV